MTHRRSLITDILTVQLLITGVITIIALAGLAWTSGAVIRYRFECDCPVTACKVS